MRVSHILAVGVGGFIGSVLRFVVGGWVNRLVGTGVIWGTLAVNVVGCFIIGVVAGVLAMREAPMELRLFVMVGLLGGFTTYSTFALDSVMLVQEGEMARSLLYMALHIVLGLVAAALGWQLSRTLA